MNRRKSLGLLLSTTITIAFLRQNLYADSKLFEELKNAEDDVYLMAHFMANDQKLYYAYSHDARNWTSLNARKPVFDSKVDLRDPYIGYAKGRYHLVHTKGWDHPSIHHYESSDLINWEGGEVKVVDENKKRAWAPEWIYSKKEDLFYLFWASEHNGHNAIFYQTTKDWKSISPNKSTLYYDIGLDVIDLTITKTGDHFQAFHKCGSLSDNFSISHMVSPTLNPHDKQFAFGKVGKGTDVTDEIVKPIEEPQIIKLNKQEKWYLYADPFFNNFIAWETTDFLNFKRIPISAPRGAKHCSLLSITSKELSVLLKKYPV
jgi:hypothetical protein